MGSKSFRAMLLMGGVALIAMPVMYLLSVRHLTDSDVPAVAALVSGAMRRNLAVDTSATVTMRRIGGALDSPRHYTVTIHPAPELSRDERALRTLMARTARMVLEEVGGKRGEPFVTCVAELGEGSSRELTFDRAMTIVPAPAATQTARR